MLRLCHAEDEQGLGFSLLLHTDERRILMTQAKSCDRLCYSIGDLLKDWSGELWEIIRFKPDRPCHRVRKHSSIEEDQIGTDREFERIPGSPIE